MPKYNLRPRKRLSDALAHIPMKKRRGNRLQVIAKRSISLPFDTIREVFSCCDRKQLCNLQNVNQRFSTIIKREFDNSPPYLVLHTLQHYWNKWRWSFQRGHLRSITEGELIQLLKNIPKFVRFSNTYISFNPNFRPADILPLKHIWENGDLRISFGSRFHPTPEIARTLTNCSYLDLSPAGNGAVLVLSDLLSGKCQKVSIWDYRYTATTMKVPWEKIVDYLFGPTGTPHLYINTIHPPERQQCLEFTENVKQKFADATNALSFKFHWYLINGNQVLLPEFNKQNRQNKQCLVLKSDARKFELSIESREI